MNQRNKTRKNFKKNTRKNLKQKTYKKIIQYTPSQVGSGSSSKVNMEDILLIYPTFTDTTTTFKVKVRRPMKLQSFRVNRFDEDTNEYVPAITPGIRRRLLNLKYKENLKGSRIQIRAFIQDTTGVELDRELMKEIPYLY
jgi:hypothetical protein